jgi:hypothetical protein
VLLFLPFLASVCAQEVLRALLSKLFIAFLFCFPTVGFLWLSHDLLLGSLHFFPWFDDEEMCNVEPTQNWH